MAAQKCSFQRRQVVTRRDNRPRRIDGYGARSSLGWPRFKSVCWYQPVAAVNVWLLQWQQPWIVSGLQAVLIHALCGVPFLKRDEG